MRLLREFYFRHVIIRVLSYSKTWFLDGSANYKSISVTVAALLGEFFKRPLCVFSVCAFYKGSPHLSKGNMCVFFRLRCHLSETRNFSLSFTTYITLLNWCGRKTNAQG